jgi:Ring finger domain
LFHFTAFLFNVTIIITMFPSFMNNVREQFDNVANDVAAQANRFRNNNINNIWNGPFGETPPPAANSNPPEHQQRAPPASTRALRQLPTIRVAPEDLMDPNNRECCVCLDDHQLDEKVVRLPCAHIFHAECILDWLTQHSCTCPVCRYELPTDNPEYEQGRLERMRHRKPRFARHELQRLSVPELLALKKQPVPSAGMEKKELIQLLIEHEWIDIIPSPEPVEYRLDTLQKMKIRELKRCMEDNGVYFRPEDVVEKADMITIFQNSGRLIVVEPPEPADIEDPRPTTTTTSPATNTCSTSSLSTSSLVLDDNAVATGRHSMTGYPGHRPTVETVTEEDSDDEDVQDQVRHASGAEVLFAQQQDDFGSSPQQSSRTTSRTESSSSIHSESTPATAAAASANAAAAASVNAAEASASTGQGATSDATMEDVTEDAPMPDASSEAAETPNTSSAGGAADQPEHPLGSRECPIDVDDPPEPANRTQDQWDPRDTFNHYTISHLQDLAKDANIDISSCFERREMVELMVRAGIFGTEDPAALSPALFQSWSVSQLRMVGAEANIDMSSCHARHEMIERILQVANTERSYLREYLRCLSPLTRKTLFELRTIARELQVDISDCLEKDEIVGRLISRSPSLRVRS